jgi:hypothetical protein
MECLLLFVYYTITIESTIRASIVNKILLLHNNKELGVFYFDKTSRKKDCPKKCVKNPDTLYVSLVFKLCVRK